MVLSWWRVVWLNGMHRLKVHVLNNNPSYWTYVRYVLIVIGTVSGRRNIVFIYLRDRRLQSLRKLIRLIVTWGSGSYTYPFSFGSWMATMEGRQSFSWPRWWLPIRCFTWCFGGFLHSKNYQLPHFFIHLTIFFPITLLSIPLSSFSSTTTFFFIHILYMYISNTSYIIHKGRNTKILITIYKIKIYLYHSLILYPK